MLRNILKSNDFLDAARLEPQFFTRDRKLPFATLMAFLLSGIRGAVQSELDFFFASLRNQADRIREVSAQAFYKARHQLRADVFTKLNLQFLSAIEADVPTPRWQGLRLVAADASTVRLTQLNKDKVRTIVDAVTFGLFLPGIELCLACTLYPLSCNERQMLFEHLAWLRQDDLLVLDRGYPGAWLAAVLSQSRIPFCIRCDMASTFKVVKEFSRSSLAEAVVTLPAPRRNDAADYECERVVTQVRLIRIITANGRSYIVMTSLIDAQAYPTAAFGDIYHARWRIEEAFKRLKHRLNLEHTSGLSWLAACQDFGAKMVCDNLNALATYLATEHHLAPDSPWRVNRATAFSHLRRLLPRVLAGVISMTARIAAQLFAEITKNLQKFRPDRRRPRPARPKPHKSHAYKPSV